MNLNNVTIGGRLTRDPEQRSTRSDRTVTTFGLAVNSSYGGKDYVDYVDVEAWNGIGDAVAKHQRKGNRVIVEGQLRHKSWQTDSGRRSKVIVRATRVHFIDWGDRQTKEPIPEQTDVADDEPVDEPTTASTDDASGDTEVEQPSPKKRSGRRRAA